MLWLLAFVAGLFGAALASEGESLFGFLTAALLVGMLGGLRRQSARIDALGEELQRLKTLAPASPLRAAEPAPGVDDIAATPARDPDPDPAPVRQEEATHAGRSPPPLPPDPAPIAEPPRPAAPGPAAGLAARVRAFVFEGNVPVKLGLLVSLFGVGALIRYAASAGWLEVPVPVRYALIALAAIALLVYGVRQTPKRPAFGLSLQGGAIGILLLTVFGSYRVPGLLPAVPAFVIVLALVAGAAVLAIRQNAVWLAAIGFLGGYLAPLLLSTGSGNHVALFTWYALLNGAVFGMAWVKPWRALNLMGFAFTFGVGALWGAQYFQPSLFATTEPFLVLFFLMFVGMPVAYALKGREPGKVDATLLFGTPLLAFPMQVALLDGERLPMAFSALAVAVVYLGIALWSRRDARLRVLGQSSAALGLAFATLAVPLALSARWTSATWALQGVALLWLGQAQARRWPQVAGVGLQLLAGLAYLGSATLDPDATAVANGHTLGLALLVLASGLCAWLFDRRGHDGHAIGGALLFGLASIWWAWLGAREIAMNLAGPSLAVGSAWIGFVALSVALAALLLWRIDWRRPAWWPALALGSALPAAGLAALETPDWLLQPQGLLLAAMGLASVAALPMLQRTPRRLAIAHLALLATLCLALGLGVREGLDSLDDGALGEGWRWILPWLPTVGLAALMLRRPRLAGWPVATPFEAYRGLALGLSLGALALLWLATLPLAGGAMPLPWLPLLNPIELFQVAGLLAAVAAYRRRPPTATLRPLAEAGLMLAGFTIASMATLRACLHLLADPAAYSPWGGGVDWSAVAALPEAQAALSVVWALGGVTCWILGSRRGHRSLWTCGATLLGLVLLKLLLVDRANLGDLLGIVSFLVVGGLLVVVGRIAPRPPGRLPESP